MSPFVQLCKYPDGTISYWAVELSQKDAEKIEVILEDYIAQGFSCRGAVNPVLDELAEILKGVEGWA